MVEQWNHNPCVVGSSPAAAISNTLPLQGMPAFTTNFFRYFVLVFIGFANGLPIPLSGSILSFWLIESGFDKSAIGFFALLSIPFAFKILWKPIVDNFTLPFFKDSPRKGWLFFSICSMGTSLFCLSFLEPNHHPWMLATCVGLLSTFSGCLYIVGLAYELESLDEKDYSVGSACTVGGYRLGLLCAGAGALYFSTLWDWSWMFRLMSCLLFLGALLILLLPEPFKSIEMLKKIRQEFLQYHTPLQGFWHQTVLQPCLCLFQNAHWKAILLLLFAFKFGDQMTKNMEGPFFLSLGFTKMTLATVSKVWGMASTLFGTFLAGMFLRGKDPFYSLTVATLIHACTLGCNYLLALSGPSLSGLYATVALEHFTGGFAMTAFIMFLWRICNKQYAAIQYALLWSVFLFKGDLLASIGGALAGILPWHIFYLVVTVISISISSIACLLCSRQPLKVK